MQLSHYKLDSKLKQLSKNIVTSILALSTLTMLSIFPTSTALANSCSKSDIDYYLQRGFSNDQVVQLCAGGSQSSGQQAQTYQAPAVQTQQQQQQSQVREDESYLSAALDADSVTMTDQKITLLPRECIEYGPTGSAKASADLEETLCVDTKLDINFAGMKVGKISRGFLLVRDTKVNIKGTIKREFIGINQLRRQDRDAIRERLSTNPTQVNLSIRKGIDPRAVASRLKKHSR